ncbi:MAG: hypothetical protein R3F34_15595 [Planctomycetota bacterium]
MVARSLLAVLLVALVPAPAVAGDDSPPATTVAPAGSWLTHGGSLARTRATATEPIRNGPLRLDVAIELDDEVVGEPRFTSDHLVVETRDGDERALHLFDLASGKRLATRTFRTRDELAPCVEGDQVVVRSAPDEALVLALTRSGFRRVRSWKSDAGSIGPPLLVDGAVVVADGEVVRRVPRLRSEGVRTSGRVEDGRWVGSLTMDGPVVYGFSYFEARPELVFATSTTFAEESANVSPYGFEVEPRRRFSSDLHCTADGRRAGFLVLWNDSGFVFDGGKRVRSFPQHSYFSDERTAVAVDLAFEPALSGANVLGMTDMGDVGRLLYLGPLPTLGKQFDPSDIVELSSPGAHPEVVEGFRSASFAQDVAYFAGRAWVPDTGRVLWHEPGLEGATMFPLDGGILAQRDDGRLEIWRVGRASTEKFFVHPEPPAERRRGVVLLLDGTVEEGPVGLSDGGVVVEGRKSETTYAFDVCWFAATDAGEVLFARGRRALFGGVLELRDRVVAAGFSRLSSAAQRSNDPAIVQDVVALGRATNVDESELEELEETEAELAAKPKKVSTKQAERAQEIREEIRAECGPVLGTAVRGVVENGSPTDSLHFDALRIALLEPALHQYGVERVRELLPAELEVPDDADFLEWLEFARSLQSHPVEIVAPPAESATNMSWEQRRLGMATAWRKDVVGFQSEHLFVITPVARPGAIARCVAMGEHVCSLLAGVFAEGTVERDERHRLVIYLYESQKEYLDQSTRASSGGESALAWTAGHFDPQKSISRLFLPKGSDAWESAANTFVHELTHHWMHERCPRLTADDVARPALSRQGYWIVEGFACVVADHVIDPLEGVVRSVDPRSDFLDVAATSLDGTLIDWAPFVSMPHVRLPALDGVGLHPVTRTWSLGRFAPVDGIGMFYAQSSALASYLFHGDDGAHRAALLDYLVAYYSGDTDDLDFEACFGMSPEVAGAAAVAFARGAVTAR